MTSGKPSHSNIASSNLMFSLVVLWKYKKNVMRLLLRASRLKLHMQSQGLLSKDLRAGGVPRH